MEKISKLKEMLGKRFVLVFAALFLLIFTLTLRNSFAYESKLKVLVLLKSESAALQQDRITDTLAELPLTLNFYDYLLDTSEVLSESDGKLSADRRLEAWKKIFHAERVPNGKGAIISLKATAASAESAQLIASDTFRALVEYSSKLYDAKTDVQLRAIDGPHASRTNGEWIWIFWGSFALALAAALMLEYAWDGLEDATRALRGKTRTDISEKIKELRDLIAPAKGESAQKTESLEGFYEKQKNQTEDELPAKKESVQAEETPVRGTYPNFPEMPPVRNFSFEEAEGSEMKSGAPDNLPVGDVPVFGQAPSNLPVADTIEEAGEGLVEKEPTQEELKARLNQLLKGKI